MKEEISANLKELYGRIAEACDDYDRDIDDITVVAISKRKSPDAVRRVVAAGVLNVGESRVQEADEKIGEVGRIARFHMVGHLQTNKVKKAVKLFDVIQSVDSLKLAEEISRRAEEAGRSIECYLEVNCSGEEQKFGVSIEEAPSLIEKVTRLPNIDLTGLMTVGPHTEDEDEIRRAFSRCHDLFRRSRDLLGPEFDTLSMGMTGDFALAIAEGATMIRIGTAIFGAR